MVAGYSLDHAVDVAHGVALLYLLTHPLFCVPCLWSTWRFDNSSLDSLLQIFPFAILKEHAFVLDCLSEGRAIRNRAKHHGW